jgi:hypothetical protein
VKGRGQVDRQDRIPFLDREILDRRDMLDAGIVDQDIAAAPASIRARQSAPLDMSAWM